MKHFIFIFALVLALLTTSQAQYPNWEPIVANLPSSVAGATSAASDGYGVHLVGVYSGVVKHFYLSNDNTIIFNNLSVTGGQYPNVTFYDGKVRVTLKLNNEIKIYQSTNGGTNWATVYTYTPNPGIEVYNINAYSDGYGTHIVWDNIESISTYNKEIYYVRYDDNEGIFKNYKNVTDLTSPSQGARAKITTTSNKAHITFVDNYTSGTSTNLTSRDLNIQTNIWDNYYIRLQTSALPVPYLSVNTVSIGDNIYSISPSDIITGYSCSQELFFSYRHKDAVNWQDHETIGCTGLGSEYLNNNILAVGDKIHLVNGAGLNGITYRTYSTANGWSNEFTVEPWTVGQNRSSIIITGGQFGAYVFWLGTDPTFHQHMRRNPFVPTVNLGYSVFTNWNMLSVPVAVPNLTKTVVWSGASGSASAFEGTYVDKDYLKNGLGYWIQFPTTQTVNYTGAELQYLSIPVKAGWNIMGSISSAIPTDKVIQNPPNNISSNYFQYNSGYQYATTILPGRGYWIKVNSDGELKLDVASLASLPPPISLEQPPNPPGAPSVPSLQAPINGTINTSLTPTLYWFSSIGATSYGLQLAADTFFTNIVLEYNNITITNKQVGTLSYSTKYYWRVRASNGIPSNWSDIWWFTTQAAPPLPDPCNPIDAFSAMDQFTVTDDNGNRQDLYSRNGGRKIDMTITDFELPPTPPTGLFNARFQSGKFAESIPPGKGIFKIPIIIKNVKYPLTFSWNIKNENLTTYWFTKPGNNKISLSGKGSFTIDNSVNDILFVEAQAALPAPCILYKSDKKELLEEIMNIPTAYSLGQNYPNPFNPTTVINYQLPENSYVSLKIHDVLGREVAKLVDEYKETGYYEVEFDASSLSSGVYIYKLTAGNYTSVKKMLLVR